MSERVCVLFSELVCVCVCARMCVCACVHVSLRWRRGECVCVHVSSAEERIFVCECMCVYEGF